MPVSIREVAERAGVSRATVSRVLNGSTEALVALPTRERIRQVAEEMGYHPSAVARGLAGKPMNSIGIVLAYDLPSVTSDPYLGPVLDGILEFNKSHRQKTVLFAEDDWKTALDNVPVYCDGHCDGLILVTPRVGSELVPAFQQSGRPFVVLGDSWNDADITMVDTDNVQVAYEAVTHLIAQGHRRIGILCGNQELRSSEQRLEGYRKAHREAGLPIDEALIVPGEYWEHSGKIGALKIATLPENVRPTALFCSNGRIAIGALQGLLEQGIEVPRQMSVMAVAENREALSAMTPRITAVQMPVREAGIAAAREVWSQVHHEIAAGRKVLLAGVLQSGDSVAAPCR